MILGILKHALMITSFVLIMMLLIEYINVQTWGYCQLNDIQTAQPIGGLIPFLSFHILGARRLLPFKECLRAKLMVVNRSRQVPTQPKQIADYTINRKKALSLSS